MTDWKSAKIRGGQFWKQNKFPFMKCYITILGNNKMVMLTDPREQGSMAIVREIDGKWIWEWEPEDLEKYLLDHNYECSGQMKQLILGENDFHS